MSTKTFVRSTKNVRNAREDGERKLARRAERIAVKRETQAAVREYHEDRILDAEELAELHREWNEADAAWQEEQYLRDLDRMEYDAEMDSYSDDHMDLDRDLDPWY